MADGKVVIDTALNNQGFIKGINNMKSQTNGLVASLKRLGGVIASVFAVRAIVGFGKNCVELGSNVAEVQNVVDTAFGNMAYKMEAFAGSSIKSFGMSQLAAKKTASTYMAMAKSMGIGSDAASNMALALTGLTGDVASFYNITQEDADTKLKSVFTGETETLKSLGVVMTQTNLDAFAMANGLGKTTASMSQSELVMLRYSYVMDTLKLAQGDFIKTQDSWANQTRILSMQWQELMSIMGQSLITVLAPVVKMLNNIVSALISAANTFNSVVSQLFGGANNQIQQTASNAASVGDAISGSVDDQNALTDATNATAKAQKKMLAGFDEVNQLSSGSADSPSGSSGSAGSTTATGGAGAALIQQQAGTESALSDQMKAFVDKITALVEPLRQINFDPLKKSFEDLRAAVAPLTEDLFSGLEWAWTNIFVPLAKWTVEDALPVFLDALAAGCDVLQSVLVALQPLGQWLWDSFLQPIAAWTGGIIVSALGDITATLTAFSDWIDAHQEAVQTMTVTAAAFMAVWEITSIGEWIIASGGLAAAIGTLTTSIVSCTVAKIADKAESLAIVALYAKDFVVSLGKTIAKLAVETAAWIHNTAEKGLNTAATIAQTAATAAWNAICAVATAVTTAFGAAVAFLTSPIGIVVIAIGALIAVVVLLIKHWDKVKEVASSCWGSIKETFSKVAGWFDANIIGPVSSGFRSFVNGLISMVESFVNFFVRGINRVISAANSLQIDIPSWVPFVGGKSFGMNIPRISELSLPRLAQGAVIPPNREFMAVLGDQHHGTNVEAPLETIQQAVAITMQPLMDAMLAFAKSGGGNIALTVNLDGRVVYENVVQRNNAIVRSTGESPLLT